MEQSQVSPRGKPKPQQSQSRPTIHDVARRAGVSKSLVSMVTRGEDGVSAEKREVILKAIEELNYRPNVLARSLVERRTRILGVMISDLRNPFFGGVVSGIQGRAAELGYRVLFNTGDRQRELEEEAIESFLDLSVDGLVLASPRVDDEFIARAGHSVPIVVLNRNTIDDLSDSVTNDNIAGARLAVEHCVSFGHERIAFISGGDSAAAQVRREGYLRAMREFDLADDILIVEGVHTEEGGFRGARELLKMKSLPTAVFASNDLCAIGAMNALEEAGLTIPDDLSVVGYDNTTLAALRHIDLTSVDQPGNVMGRSAIDRIAERINGERLTPRHDVVAPSIVVRSTTGPPPDQRKGVTPSTKPFENTSHLNGSE
ncbi:MAG: LacI family transcriptional regulator [Acidobacteria bacterium]|nr:LacI family transcriptional regulator [Acidobacteriota bacterium]